MVISNSYVSLPEGTIMCLSFFKENLSQHAEGYHDQNIIHHSHPPWSSIRDYTQTLSFAQANKHITYVIKHVMDMDNTSNHKGLHWG